MMLLMRRRGERASLGHYELEILLCFSFTIVMDFGNCNNFITAIT